MVTLENWKVKLQKIREELDALESILDGIVMTRNRQIQEQQKRKFFMFNGREYEIDYWNQLLPRLCEEIYQSQPDITQLRFKLLELTHRRGYPKFYEKCPEEYPNDHKYKWINGLDLFVKSYYRRDYTERLARTLVSHLRYDPKSDVSTRTAIGGRESGQ